MTAPALALVLAASVIHCGWNALAKHGRDQLMFLWSSVTLAAFLFLPAGLSRLPRGGVPGMVVPYVAATIALHAFYFYALGRAYGAGDFSFVYPIARGLGVALVPLLAFTLRDERLSPPGALGVALVAASVVGISRAPRPLGRVRPVQLGAGAFWALATGFSIAGYSLVDKAGVGRLDPVAYLAIMGLGTSAVLVPVILANRDALRLEWTMNGRAILVSATMNLTSYLLVLFAFRLSKTAYVVAARETSIIFSLIVGRVWFGEGALGLRLVAAAMILAGVACVAAAR